MKYKYFLLFLFALCSCEPQLGLLNLEQNSVFVESYNSQKYNLKIETTDKKVQFLPTTEYNELKAKNLLIGPADNYFKCDGGFIIESINTTESNLLIEVNAELISLDDPDTDSIEGEGNSTNPIEIYSLIISPGYSRETIWLHNRAGTYKVQYGGYIWYVYNQNETSMYLMPSYRVDLLNKKITDSYSSYIKSNPAKSTTELFSNLWEKLKSEQLISADSETSIYKLSEIVDSDKSENFAFDMYLCGFARYLGYESKIISNNSRSWCEIKIDEKWIAIDPSPESLDGQSDSFNIDMETYNYNYYNGSEEEINL
jgi:hypothetical protein